ncbi:hypothetical protein FNV62_00170 [Streptomyces sp. RLB3-17]|nr:hypothetical protein FNV58_01580 [Streptomyces sp. RLB1-9]QDO16765.1 hypothetical protein FNV65_00150 [Streptomyces sp. S1A1-8]QDO26888.1 hypothetical protein FNV63_00145 [Streptomyces sp. S1A1-3]QDO36928.1 hypothetical protein FNV62_00170 [Streptomyces sp. RLB3-17]
MDHCSSCRRYLNGALVRPGCGPYAPKPVRPSRTPAGGPPSWPQVPSDGSREYRRMVSQRRRPSPSMPSD